MDSQTLQTLLTPVLPLGAEFGAGGALFFVLGYGLKKLAKLLSMVFAFFASVIGLGVWYANIQGWIQITIDWVKVEAAIVSSSNWLLNALVQLVNTLPQAGAFFSGSAVGFLAGLKKG